MTRKNDALEELWRFLLGAIEHLKPGKQLGSFEFEDSWQQFKIVRLRLFVEDLEIEATKFDADTQGVVGVRVWNPNDIDELIHKFHMKGRIPHVARVVADYINEYEATE